jgi:hypothetical protein
VTRTLVTACNLAYAPGALGLLRSLREFHPEVRAVCLAPVDEVSDLQRELGRLAEVHPLGRHLAGVPTGLLYHLMTARMFTTAFGGASAAWVDGDIVFTAPAPELWDVPAGKVNVIGDPGYSLGEMVPEDARPKFFTPDFPFDFHSQGFNGGVFALRPSEWPDLPERFERELAVISYGYYPVYYDQPVLNRMFLRYANWLPLPFNATAVNEIGVPSDVRLLHYTNFLQKPWKPDFPRSEPAYYYWLRYGEQERGRSRLAAARLRILAGRPVRFLRRVTRKIRYLSGGLRDDKAKKNEGHFELVRGHPVSPDGPTDKTG